MNFGEVMTEMFYFNDNAERVFIDQPFMTSEQARDLCKELIENKNLLLDDSSNYNQFALGLLGQRVVSNKTCIEEGVLEFEKDVGGVISYISVGQVDEDLYGFFVEFDDGKKSTLAMSEFHIEVVNV
jgi:hypothetical protein